MSAKSPILWVISASANYLHELLATHYLTYSTLSLLFWLRNEEGTKDRFYCLKEISAYTCQDYTMGSANPNHDDNSFTNGLKLLLCIQINFLTSCDTSLIAAMQCSCSSNILYSYFFVFRNRFPQAVHFFPF